jgi:hypothetical protein
LTELVPWIEALEKDFGEEWLERELDVEPIDLKVSIGDVNLIMQDLPVSSMVKGKDPLETPGFEDPSRHYRNMGEGDLYVKSAKRAKVLLEKKGLDKLWYGTILVQPKDKALNINYVGHEGKAGGSYSTRDDIIKVYSDAGNYITELLAHELGHRYYFKFMNERDRANFDKWFGDVEPVSSYGGTVSSEDFAEVFAWYVMNKELTADQKDRFKRFLGRGGTKKVHSSMADYIQVEDYIETPWKVVESDFEKVYAYDDPTGSRAPQELKGWATVRKKVRDVELEAEFEWALSLRGDDHYLTMNDLDITVTSAEPDLPMLEADEVPDLLSGGKFPQSYYFSNFFKEEGQEELVEDINVDDLLY